MADEEGREIGENSEETAGIPPEGAAQTFEGHQSDPGPNTPLPPKANVLNRSIAKFIDILLALLLSRLPGYIGVLAGLTYIGIADGLMDGRSVGKRIIGLRVRKAGDLAPADFRSSVLRNATIGILYLVFLIPLLGWAIAALGLGFELLLILGSAEGMRLGDEIASTVVVDEVKV